MFFQLDCLDSSVLIEPYAFSIELTEFLLKLIDFMLIGVLYANEGDSSVRFNDDDRFSLYTVFLRFKGDYPVNQAFLD